MLNASNFSKKIWLLSFLSIIIVLLFLGQGLDLSDLLKFDFVIGSFIFFSILISLFILGIKTEQSNLPQNIKLWRILFVSLSIVLVTYIIGREIYKTPRYVNGWTVRYISVPPDNFGNRTCEAKGVFETKAECENWANVKKESEKEFYPNASYECKKNCDYRFYYKLFPDKFCDFACIGTT